MTVTIDTAFTEDERRLIEEGFRAWNAQPQSSSCADIVFGGFQFGTDPGFGTVTNPVYWVTYYGQTIGGGSTAHSASSGYISRASTTLDRSIRVSRIPGDNEIYAKSLVRHEIGHTLHLDDKYDCGSNLCTIMCDGTGLAPDITTCDDRKVRDIYRPAPTPTPTPAGSACFLPVNPEGGCAAGTYLDGYGYCC